MRDRARLGALVLGIGLGVAACAAPRASLGTSASPCFRALAAGKAAVHDRGHFVGTRRVTAGTLERLYGDELASRPAHACLVGYSGDYRIEDVDQGRGQPRGKYAVVVVSTHGWLAVVTFVADRLPVRLRRP